MSLAILFHFLCVHHISDINISIFRSLQLCCWIIRLPTTTKRQNTSHQTHITIHRKFTLTLNHPSLQNKTTDVVIQQHNRKLLKMDILMSETCWVHKKWNKIASDIKLVFRSSAEHFLDIIWLSRRFNLEMSVKSSVTVFIFISQSVPRLGNKKFGG